jgi:Tfp pilus assembly protein PilZ
VLGRYGRKYPKAAVNWYVLARSADRDLDGVTQEISPRQAYIRCNRPFRLNEVVDVVINAPERTLEFKAEVVWSNIYGRDDEITPRGMGVRFLQVSKEDQKYLKNLMEEHKKPNIEKIASKYLEKLT